MTVQRDWRGRWIKAPGAWQLDKVAPAPYFRRSFTCGRAPGRATVYLCGLGWHELYVNGVKADDTVLAPSRSQYDRHVLYVEYDVAALLRPGLNAVAVILGNGEYNCHTPPESMHAPWRDSPKLLCDVEIDGETVVFSDTDWKCRTGPITFDALQEGERYDARLEIPGFADAESDDSTWPCAAMAMPPAGLVIRQEMEPCRVMETLPAVKIKKFGSDQWVVDFGKNISGWCRIAVKGPAGSRLRVEHGELVRDNFDLDLDYWSWLPRYPDGFQEEGYTLKGDGVEVYEPRFTMHGFRYAKISADNFAVELVEAEARFVHTDFAEAGQLVSSDAALNRLQEITRQSYRCNFTGIPTDCPHREKRGWTGDAHLACETGLWNYDALRGYKHFVRMVFDAQRPSGQLCALVPTGGWGYNWGSGPAWDSAVFEIPWQLWRFYGDTECIENHYDAMARYLDYCGWMSREGLVDFGLGDWLCPEPARATPVAITSSAYYYDDLRKMAVFARLLGRGADAEAYGALADEAGQAFRAAFALPGGRFGDGGMTATAAALHFGLAEAGSAGALLEIVREAGHRANFGILGAKYVPRALAEAGFIDDAYRVITQEEFPGWGYWVKQGATSLWEVWDGRSSRNHIMFGDVSAWMFQYLGGLSPLAPGFGEVKFAPRFPERLESFDAWHRTPHGQIRARWHRSGEAVHCVFEGPEELKVQAVLPGGETAEFHGRREFRNIP